YCGVCDREMPPRSHHCVLCKRCVLVREHHCFFLGTCIGGNNLKSFCQLLFFISSGCLLALILCLRYLNLVHLSLAFGFFIMELNVVVVGFVASTSFLAWHVFLICTGLTSYEFYTKKL
ncbi:hypothetical protein HELRODRAFT_145957, partial [Helobdella robusta]|uniref:Palmitoyltransferase n=1 Tax=Helobdella robusta TaxID=6412 RepID=T1EJP3_HELRO